MREHFATCNWRTSRSDGRRAIDAVFSKSREKSSNEMLKAGASELLTVFPAFRHFLHLKVPKEKLEPQLDSMLVLLEICDIISMAMKESRPEKMKLLAQRLAFAAATHLEAFKLAYGPEHARPKHHEAQHLARQMLADLVRPCMHIQLAVGHRMHMQFAVATACTCTCNGRSVA